jgi:hypothetical protein
MDMITIDDVHISKFDIRALKVGKNVPFELKEELKKFNSKFLGKESVFPTKNGAPRMLTQYKDEPYTLELLDQYTVLVIGTYMYAVYSVCQKVSQGYTRAQP